MARSSARASPSTLVLLRRPRRGWPDLARGARQIRIYREPRVPTVGGHQQRVGPTGPHEMAMFHVKRLAPRLSRCDIPPPSSFPVQTSRIQARGKNYRSRQSKGRRRQDDICCEPGSRLGGSGAKDPSGRCGSPGQCDERSGSRAPISHRYHVRRPSRAHTIARCDNPRGSFQVARPYAGHS